MNVWELLPDWTERVKVSPSSQGQADWKVSLVSSHTTGSNSRVPLQSSVSMSLIFYTTAVRWQCHGKMDCILYSAFIQSAVQLMPLIHPFTHTLTQQRPGWDRTGNPPTARRQLLPPEPSGPVSPQCPVWVMELGLSLRRAGFKPPGGAEPLNHWPGDLNCFGKITRWRVCVCLCVAVRFTAYLIKT